MNAAKTRAPLLPDAAHILVVDDDRRLRDLLARFLADHGFRVTVAKDAAEARARMGLFVFDALILDVMMPGMNGFEVCEKLRKDGLRVGVLFLTAKDSTDDKVTGLTIGGDDYMVKPFSLEELIARVRAILRRTGDMQIDIDDELIRFADLELNEATHEVRRGGNLIELSPTEFTLLRYLLINADRVVSKAQILDHVWQYDFRGDAGIVETYISYLRKKIDTYEPQLIHTVRGVGYRLRLPSKAA